MSWLFHLLLGARVLVIVDLVATWLQAESELPRQLTNALTAPLYGPLRELTSGLFERIDPSPLFVLVALHLVELALRRAGSRAVS